MATEGPQNNLLTLPPELRLQIYEELWLEPLMTKLEFDLKRTELCIAPDKSDVAFLRTSKQIYAEAGPIFARRHQVWLKFNTGWPAFKNAASDKRWLERLDELSKQKITCSVNQLILEVDLCLCACDVPRMESAARETYLQPIWQSVGGFCRLNNIRKLNVLLVRRGFCTVQKVTPFFKSFYASTGLEAVQMIAVARVSYLPRQNDFNLKLDRRGTSRLSKMLKGTDETEEYLWCLKACLDSAMRF